MNKDALLSFVVTSPQKSMRLSTVIFEELKGKYSKKQIKALIDDYGCSINGRVQLFSNHKLCSDDRVCLNLDKFRKAHRIKSMDVLLDHDDFFVVDKPAKTPSEIEYFKKALKDEELYLVHRLDRDTTGAMIVARNLKAKEHFENLFRSKRVKKSYLCICCGKPDQTSFRVDRPLVVRQKYSGATLWKTARRGEKGSKSAETVFACKSRYNTDDGEFSVIECNPKTGRTHQLRVHLASIGLPILGDYQYSKMSRFSLSPNRYFLHSSFIGFQYLGETYHVKSKKAEDFILMQEKLKKLSK